MAIRYYLRTTTANIGSFTNFPASIAIPSSGESQPDVSSGPFDLSLTPGTVTGRLGPPSISQTAPQDMIISRFISPALSAGNFNFPTLWTCGWSVSNSDVVATTKAMCSIYIGKSDTTVRGFIFDSHTPFGNAWVSNAGFNPKGRVFSFIGSPIAGVIATDKLVIEVWAHTVQSAASVVNNRIEFDGSIVPTEGLDTGNDARSYVEYDQIIEPAPQNQQFASAAGARW